MTIKVTLEACNPKRKLVQNFAGCTDVEDGKAKAKLIFPGCRILKAEELEEKATKIGRTPKKGVDNQENV